MGAKGRVTQIKRLAALAAAVAGVALPLSGALVRADAKVPTGDASIGSASSRPTPVQSDAVIYEQASPAFVTRAGTQLLLDGQPYHFSGLNIYNANNLGGCWYPLGSESALDDALTAIGPVQTVFRAWFFQDMATSNGRRDWTAFDNTLAIAQAHGERVIATLANQSGDCEPATPLTKTETWYAGGYRTVRPVGLPSTYRDWVAEVVARYRDNPTILAWQLMNEASAANAAGRCTPTASATLRAFAEDVGSLVKSTDPHHLLSLGTLGAGECGTIGDDYQRVYSVASLDLCEYHDYGSPQSALTGDASNGLQRRVQQCTALDKPLFVGEMGIRLSGSMAAPERAALFKARLTAQREAGVAGSLLWDWFDGSHRAYSGYEIGPDDPALMALKAFVY